ncbi:MAG TPA: pseudouridine synthase [Candidatus Acidoferrales bacterium]|nr:pseudouridine synthase [Candidatus Acidoferrales bacterium]
MRLQKYLAHAGIAARRKAEELISAGRVRVNGRVVRELGTTVAPSDRVEVEGVGLAALPAPRYIVLHKPVRVMTTMRDPQGRRSVAEFMPPGPRVVPVGRLDYDTSGVLLLTNDGDLANILLHPRFGVEKTYRALVRGRLEPAQMRALLSGVALDEGAAAGAKLRVVKASANMSTIDITIHEGRNRQVRRMFEAVGHEVVSLTRLRFGPIALGELPPGHWREATSREVVALTAVARAAAAPGGERV